jgi:hypothetical protein
MPRLLLAIALAAAACSEPVRDPLRLDGNRLTVDNQTSEDWLDVEIWLNQQYRVTVPKIQAGSRFNAGLDSFVAGFGQRFNFSRQQITDLRLAAKQADGTPVELKMQFRKSGLAGALGGKE